ncbi:hypothetical protein HPP92_004230 [Vanilla planifolia]|uniref:Glycosyltransferase n=1 Tax=Vanilla planifolia TaxID=51239 RepID=A0A835RJG2_VANPL|nr:hypothetical protein HPP92_004230 [Vanilla planifolia]
MAERNQAAHVVLLPSPGVGHLIPFVELAKRLVIHHNLTATIITFSDFSTSKAQRSILSSLPFGVSYVSLPSVPIDDLLTEGNNASFRLSLIMPHYVPSIRHLLLNLHKTTPIAAYVIDLFGGDIVSIANDLCIPKYLFFTSNFFFLAFQHHSITLSGISEKLELPGCFPLGRDTLSLYLGEETSSLNAKLARTQEVVDGILVNSFETLEEGYSQLAKDRKIPVWLVGPLTRVGSGSDFKKDAIFTWLDQQPIGSVLFVSFGSGGTLSFEQTQELALGLEMSKQRFLWVLHPPFDADTHVLTHGAIGGFLSHCGWNSTLESIVCGVPMIAWPLYAEQPINAEMLVKGVKVALRPIVGEDGVMRKEAVANVVKELMEGEGGKEVRNRIRVMMKEAAKAMEQEGPSSKSLANIANLWKMTKLD